MDNDVTHVCRYLQEEWNARRRASDGEREINKDNMKGCCVKCPQQSNFSDCGIYVLQYAESFFMVSASYSRPSDDVHCPADAGIVLLCLLSWLGM